MTEIKPKYKVGQDVYLINPVNRVIARVYVKEVHVNEFSDGSHLIQYWCSHGKRHYSSRPESQVYENLDDAISHVRNPHTIDRSCFERII